MYAPPEGNNTPGKAIYNERKFTLHSHMKQKKNTSAERNS